MKCIICENQEVEGKDADTTICKYCKSAINELYMNLYLVNKQFEEQHVENQQRQDIEKLFEILKNASLTKQKLEKM